MALRDGIYEFRTGADGGWAMDVIGGSQAFGARMQVYPRNGSNAQKFIVKNESGAFKLLSGASGGRLAVGAQSIGWAGDLVLGIRQGGAFDTWTDEDSAFQVRVPELGACNSIYLTSTASGSQGYRIYDNVGSRSMSNGAVVEANELAANITTSLIASWVPIASWLTDPACATVGRCCVSEGTVTSSDVLVVDTNPHIINLLAQIPAGYTPIGKARWRSRYTHNDEVHDWSAWQTVQGSWTQDEDFGWGEPWVACQFATTEVEGQEYAIVGCGQSVTLPANSKMEYQCEVALLSSGDGDEGAFTLGAVRSFSCKVQSAVAVTDGDAVVAFDGLRVTYYTDMRKNFASAHVVVRDSAGNVLNAGTSKAPAKAAHDTITIPWANMARVPAVPEELDITLTLTDQEGVASVDRDTWTTTYDGEHGSDIEPDIDTVGARVRIRSTAGAVPDGSKCWVTWGGTTEVITTNFQQDRDYWSIPPINAHYTVWFMWNNPNNPDAWASFAYEGVLNPQPAGWFIDALDLSWELPIRANLKDAPSLTVEYEPEVEEESVMNRRRPLVSIGSVTKKSWSVEAVLTERYGDNMDELLGAFEKCAEGVHGWFRDDRGMRERVAITGAEIDRSRLHDYPIKLDMQSEVI